jgi:23S rRNA pseudouridine1911/1915/1917 synthase
VSRRLTVIAPHEAGVSLVSWLAGRFTYHDSAGWEAELEDRRVLVDGEPAEGHMVLRRGMRVSYDPPAVPEPEVNREYRIVRENPDFLVVNKPPDLPVHPGGIYLHNTLQSMLSARYGTVYLISRLDRETSGLMLIARNAGSADYLYRQQRKRKILKEYLCLVHGDFPPFRDARGWLIKSEKSAVRKKRIFMEDPAAEDPGDAGSPGRSYCRTELFLESRKNGLSLLRCRLHTGKTHQIRASLCSLGFPLVGDKIYGRDETLFLRFIKGELTEEDQKCLLFPHQALFSARLSFCFSPSNIVVDVSAEPPFWTQSLFARPYSGSD